MLKDPRLNYFQICKLVGLENCGSIVKIARRNSLLHGAGTMPEGFAWPPRKK